MIWYDLKREFKEWYFNEKKTKYLLKAKSVLWNNKNTKIAIGQLSNLTRMCVVSGIIQDCFPIIYRPQLPPNHLFQSTACMCLGGKTRSLTIWPTLFWDDFHLINPASEKVNSWTIMETAVISSEYYRISCQHSFLQK